MPTKDEALLKILTLAQRFEEQREFYNVGDYNETQPRRDFIDPFWKALFQTAQRLFQEEIYDDFTNGFFLGCIAYLRFIHQSPKTTFEENHQICQPPVATPPGPSSDNITESHRAMPGKDRVLRRPYRLAGL